MKIMFVGDISLGEYYMSFGHGPRTYAGKNNIFANVDAVFKTADVVIGNLEAPITHHGDDMSEPESMVLKVDPDHAEQLSEAGFGLMQVANNHTVQHGNQGFDDSLQTLQKVGIKAVGLNQQEPVVLEADGLRIAFMAASDVPDNTDKAQSKYQRLDETFLERVESAAGDFDHLVVMFHWGLEASTSPLPYQREIVDRLYDAGVSAVIGTHPHLFYEIEKRQHFISAYSLGNFVFDLCWDNRMTKSGILEIDFHKDDLSATYWPVEIEENGCLPTPSGDPVPINQTIKPYDLGDKMDHQQVRKVIYMLANLMKGRTALKSKFFYRKFCSAIRPSSD